MEWILEQVNQLLAHENWPSYAKVCRAVLFIYLFFACMKIWRSPLHSHSKKSVALPWSYRIFFIIIALSFSVLLIHQASWQLAGQSRPRFLAFMQLHDRRAFNPAHNIQRGKILDRKGQILAHTVPGKKASRRIYPHGPVTAHVVGYADPKFGTYGMEKSENSTLTGATMKSLEEWKSVGKGLLEEERTVQGKNLRLSLDIRLQRQAHQLLGAHRGAVVLMDVKTGDLLVCASKPSFNPMQIDNKLFAGGKGESVLLNRATHGLYSPGSTFKVVTAVAAVENSFKGNIDCPAQGWTTSSKYPRIHDYGYYAAQKNGTYWGGYGSIDLSTGFAKSSNIYFARLGTQLGMDKLHQTGKRMKFNERIPLHRTLTNKSDAPSGSLPKLAKSDRYGLAQMSMGQGKVLSTPLHMALITAAIANGGTPPKPRISLEQKPTLLSPFMESSSAKTVGAMMRKVVTHGTGRRLANSPLAVAGKTGTADHGGDKPHAWFIAYAPYDAPRYAIAVLVEDGGFGSSTALPIADKLFQSAIAFGYMEVKR